MRDWVWGSVGGKDWWRKANGGELVLLGDWQGAAVAQFASWREAAAAGPSP